MGFFSKIFGRSPSTPEWAAFLNLDEYAAFEDHLRQSLAARSLPSSAGDVRSGAVPLKVGKENGSLGFSPIARKCRGLEQEKWAGLIAEHLDRALEPKDELVARLGALRRGWLGFHLVGRCSGYGQAAGAAGIGWRGCKVSFLGSAGGRHFRRRCRGWRAQRNIYGLSKSI